MKNNIVRKALSLLLAGVMMASAASPAFAGEVSESEAGAGGAAQETEKTAQEIKEPITLAGLYSEETKEPEAQPQGEEKEDGGFVHRLRHERDRGPGASGREGRAEAGTKACALFHDRTE